MLVALRVDMIPELIRRLKLHLQMRVGRSGHTNPQLASRLYSELLRVLDRRGISRRDTQTPFEFASTVGDARVGPAVREFTEIYGRARYGDAPCNAVRLRELHRVLKPTGSLYLHCEQWRGRSQLPTSVQKCSVARRSELRPVRYRARALRQRTILPQLDSA